MRSRHEPDGGVCAHAGGAQADDPAEARPDHLHQLGGRPERQRRAGELRGVESRPHRICQGVALEVASRNITVNVVAPGLIETDMTRGITRTRGRPGNRGFRSAASGTPDDVASAVCFLASDEASYITGQVLAVNGGMYM